MEKSHFELNPLEWSTRPSSIWGADVLTSGLRELPTSLFRSRAPYQAARTALVRVCLIVDEIDSRLDPSFKWLNRQDFVDGLLKPSTNSYLHLESEKGHKWYAKVRNAGPIQARQHRIGSNALRFPLRHRVYLPCIPEGLNDQKRVIVSSGAAERERAV